MEMLSSILIFFLVSGQAQVRVLPTVELGHFKNSCNCWVLYEIFAI